MTQALRHLTTIDGRHYLPPVTGNGKAVEFHGTKREAISAWIIQSIWGWSAATGEERYRHYLAGAKPPAYEITLSRKRKRGRPWFKRRLKSDAPARLYTRAEVDAMLSVKNR
jgi:hypothetical protein